jgi:hypothetical protein
MEKRKLALLAEKEDNTPPLLQAAADLDVEMIGGTEKESLEEVSEASGSSVTDIEPLNYFMVTERRRSSGRGWRKKKWCKG